jgi:uncharacterized membrane protein YcaP (DUF421 family)
MWNAIFHLPVSLSEKILRTILIYLFLVVALRIFGKRELGQANTLDLLVLLLVANAVQNGIIGNDVSVTGAIVGAIVLFGLNAAFARGIFRFPWMATLLEGEPSLLIEEGRPNLRVLRRECISLPDLRSIARRQGFPDPGSVETAILETNGGSSPCSTPTSRRTTTPSIPPARSVCASVSVAEGPSDGSRRLGGVASPRPPSSSRADASNDPVGGRRPGAGPRRDLSAASRPPRLDRATVC